MRRCGRTLTIARMPEGYRWRDLSSKSGIEQLNFYKRLLLTLSTGKDGETPIKIDPMVTAIYAEAQTSLREPRHLAALVKTFDSLNWFSADKDDLGDVYEGLLEKNATETKSGAG